MDIIYTSFCFFTMAPPTYPVFTECIYGNMAKNILSSGLIIIYMIGYNITMHIYTKFHVNWPKYKSTFVYFLPGLSLSCLDLTHSSFYWTVYWNNWGSCGIVNKVNGIWIKVISKYDVGTNVGMAESYYSKIH